MMYSVEIDGISLEIETAEGIFSPRAADSGTLAMLAETEILPTDRVLDLGCGSGIVGIYCARKIGAERVTMCDISPEAVEISRTRPITPIFRSRRGLFPRAFLGSRRAGGS